MFEIAEKLTKSHFDEMEILEKKYYDEEFITSSEESYAWYLKHPSSTQVVTHFGKVVGFLNMFPISKDLFNTIKEGNYNDAYLKAEDIVLLKEFEVEVYLFLSCIVVDKEFRRTPVLKMLIESYVNIYKKYPINGIITDNITENGAAFSERMGFQFLVKSDHNSKIYIGGWNDFEKFGGSL